jgi:hypothetical protein
MSDKKQGHDENPDPITSAPGAHPVGVGLGSTSGAAIGAVAGAVAGPVGVAVGATVGGVAGGLAGKGLAELANPTVEGTYWRKNHASRPYATPGVGYEEYEPAYRLGWEGSGRYGELNWESVEPRLREDWNRGGGGERLDWDKASPAVRDAWNRLRADANYRKENI